eukprot:1653092-Prymnesium_polylepis.1
MGYLQAKKQTNKTRGGNGTFKDTTSQALNLKLPNRKHNYVTFKSIMAGRADDPNSPRGGVCTKDPTCRDSENSTHSPDATREPVDR